MCLDGKWQFSLDADDVGIEQRWFEKPEILKDTIRVPGCWQGQGYGNDGLEEIWDFKIKARVFQATYKGTAWYGYRFRVPEDWRNQRVWLNFGGVHPSAADISERLASEVDADAVYYDCVATSPPTFCFNLERGHPVGGGTHHVDAYWHILSEARRRILAVKKQTVLSVEGGAEPYPFDAWLLTNGQGWTDPVRDVVYSGFKIRFAPLDAPYTLGGGLAFVRTLAHQLLWGAALSVCG